MGEWLIAGVGGVVVSPLIRRLVAAHRSPPPAAAVAVACAAAVLAAVALARLHDDQVALVALPPLAISTVALIHIDRVRQLLPDTILRSCYAIVAVILTSGAIITGNPGQLLRAAAAGAICLTGYAVLAAGGGLGFGDVKLAGLLGMACGWISWGATVCAVVFAFFIGAVAGARELVARGRRATFAFGPSMIYAALAALALT